MKTVFDKDVRTELICRINTLDENSKSQWGKINIRQMLMHCSLWEKMTLGKSKLNRVFIGRIFGKLALKGILKNASPLTRNTPSSPELVIKQDITTPVILKKKEWIGLIEEYEHFSNFDFLHPFFGKMTREQIGYLAYKHSDHHLRQFNV
ncbi:DUF1569 domain-containing protein [Pedobacter sp. PAMC26386]|nr:DUF1569 domain-containing protein [Pedobacter sp. PAMC26386]